MKKLTYISLVSALLVTSGADALNPYRKKAEKPSVEINLIALRYLEDNIAPVQSAPVYAAPIDRSVAAPRTIKRTPRSQPQAPAITAPRKVATPAPVAAPKITEPKAITRPKPVQIPKIIEPANEVQIPKLVDNNIPAPAISIPPLPSSIKADSEVKPLPVPTFKAPEIKAPEPIKIPEIKAPAPVFEPAPTIEAPKFSPVSIAPTPDVNQVVLPTIPTFTPPAFEAPTISAPDLEIPKFEAPQVPEAPSLPNISSNDDQISVPELPAIEKQIADSSNTRTVNLPLPIFNDEPVRSASNATKSELPPVSGLFGEAPIAPIAPVANIDPSLKPIPNIGKPSLESVQIQAQSLPTLDSLPLSAEQPVLSVPFSEAEVDFPLSEQAGLLEIISNMHSNPNTTIRVVSYASGSPEQSSQAKRTSLARALSVRKLLKERDIESERIIIRPVGNKSTTGVPDRVDIFLTAKEGA